MKIRRVIDRIEHKSRAAKLWLLIKFLLLIFIIYVKATGKLWLSELGITDSQIQAVLFYLTSNLMVVISRLLVIIFYLRQRQEHPYDSDNFVLGVRWIGTSLNFVFLVVTVFLFFDIDYRALFTSLSIIAAAIAILSKDYISNMINGMIILFTDHVSLGDYVKVKEHRGKIVDVNLTNVHLLNEDDDLVLIPNQIMLNVEVINYTKRIINRVNIEFEVAYTYLENVGELEEYLIGVLKPYDEHIEKDSCFLRTAELKKDTALFHFQYIIKFPDKNVERRIRRAILRNVVKYISQKKEVSK